MSLNAAIAHLGFVQADPIRSPARAQDLILRHRVESYHAGDLEKQYSALDVEEDYLYAYGFLPRVNRQLLHPRHNECLSKQEKLVVRLASEHGEIHPRDLRPHFGDERQLNAWGGYSKVSTRILEELHYKGLLRIARREDGIKIYGSAERVDQPLQPEERLRELVILIASILAPLPESSLRSAVNHLAYAAPNLPGRPAIVKQLVQEEALGQIKIDGINYVWPKGSMTFEEAPNTVRILAPFDPLVWDRKRFEHLWGWAYRFEAYTPPPKRRLGYYAMPLLWRDEVIGWANVSIKSGKLDVETGYVRSKPKERAFRASLDEEVSRMKLFLGI